MLPIAGGALGLLIKVWGVDAGLSPANLPRLQDAGVDGAFKIVRRFASDVRDRAATSSDRARRRSLSATLSTQSPGDTAR